MSDAYFTNPLVFLIQTLFGLYITIVVIRFLLQWVRADFYNPISQFVVQVTTPVLRPMRRVIPSVGGLDTASVVLAWGLKAVELMLMTLALGLDRNLLGALFWAIPALISLVFSLFLFAVLIRVLLSWVNPDPYNPGVALLNRITDPLLGPAQRLLPPIAGVDLSPMLVMLALVVLEMLVVPPLQWITGSPF